MTGEGPDDIVVGSDDIVLIGRDDEDYFYTEFVVSGEEPISGSTVAGGKGDDRFIGTIGDDELYGGEGSDLFIGSGGADKIFGGAGNDILRNMRFPNEVISATARR